MRASINFFLLALIGISVDPTMHIAGFQNSDHGNRRKLHEPLFPVDATPPTPAEPPPPEIPDNPASDWPFFPQAPPGSRPYPTPTTNNPANVTSTVPRATQPPAKPAGKIAMAISGSLAAIVMLSALVFFVYRHRIKKPVESEKLFAGRSRQNRSENCGPRPETSNSSEFLYIGTLEPSHRKQEEPNGSSYHKLSSNGGLEIHRPSPDLQPLSPLTNRGSQLYGPSPELRPLPPLTGKNRRLSSPVMSPDEDQFYPSQDCAGANNESPYRPISRRLSSVSQTRALTKGEGTSNSTSHSNTATGKLRPDGAAGVRHAGGAQPPLPPPPAMPKPPLPPPPAMPNPPLPPPPAMLKPPLQCNEPKTPSPPQRKSKFSSPPSPGNLPLPTLHDQPLRTEKISNRQPAPPPAPLPRAPPPPPPPPPLPRASAPPPPLRARAPLLPPQAPPPGRARATESCLPPLPMRILARPQPMMPTPLLVKPEPVAEANRGESSSEQLDAEENKDCYRPRLKPLHWDKVRATSDRAMVWDQLKSSSFQLNEDMIETLFCNSTNNVQKESARRTVLPPVKQGNKVLDPKKSQNIAILLRALNVTREEVCEALLDGNPEGLGTDLLETLIKMAPTKEEELKLKEYRDDISKLGSAERFLKAVLDIPFAFKRVDAMLYRANFDSEVKYLRKCFESIEAACLELKNSRLFLKLLEAVLKTGNRMNVGTNRGGAEAFKLDTLLKLVDVKGTDGKTTLLHFVVQEIIRSEGSGLCSNKETVGSNPKAHEDDFTKQGLRIVAGLSSELCNVRKAAGMDSDVLSSYVSKLATGLEKINLVLRLEDAARNNEKSNFFEAMTLFLNEAKEDITQVKAEEKKAMSQVKEITDYFHGDSAKEEAHPFRIFMIVRDFLSVLDQVCKEVREMQERTITSSSRSFRISASASLPVFPRFDGKREGNMDEDSSSP